MSDKPPASGKSSIPGKNGKSRKRALGPVANLEEHVPPEWWRGIFNSLYLKTDSDVVADPNITRQEAEYFARLLQLSPEDKVLDLCCGQGRHSLELARRGFRGVEGLDRSHFLIQKARSLAKKEGLPVKFREGDARKLPYSPDAFDAALILGNSFGYFETAHEDLKVLQGVCRALKPWGKLLIDVSDGEYLRERFQPRSWEWLDDKHFVCRERALSADGRRLISREVVTHVEKGVLVDQFYAERLYSRPELMELLRAAGFHEAAVHGEIATGSQRNQDLGMMERRIILTGVARKEWTPLRKRPKEAVRTVAVVMGDPGKQDIVKPDAVFDEDDLYTIDQLKAALRELKDYRFLYLSNHDSLIAELAKLKGKADFVLNLCDEGLANDPLKELHVPALLEALGIPFTGAGPQCLAYCYDKSLVRGIAKEMDIPVPEAFFIKPGESTFEMPFAFPAIVKPNFGDSSFGITQKSVVHDHEELLNVVTELHRRFGYEKPILVEEFLAGADLTVGIIGNPDASYTVFPVSEEDYSELPEELPRICGYEAKWDPESPYARLRSIPASLPDVTEKRMVDASLKLFERLGCRDYARFDWRLDAEGNPKLLEVNPNPGWCWDGHLAKMAKFTGVSYAGMLEAILRAAEQRLGLDSQSPDRPAERKEEAAGEPVLVNGN
ncbi:MAG: methyltransferase domain-containing protein [Candidatus Tectomicrobia bacterium]|uniref:Methyltransferase domain-containing protein n=1 Tax=Tectimicrobiota bacterium TaxID=2528274 RepID=A0A932I2B1_UNCTE|nr:methyltransferase domain-containing protein [Candidatus Tectomicrobia bacterium]